MRQSRLLRWIEEAEAREVLVTAMSEQPVPLLPPTAGVKNWVMRLRCRTFGERAGRLARGPPGCVDGLD